MPSSYEVGNVVAVIVWLWWLRACFFGGDDEHFAPLQEPASRIRPTGTQDDQDVAEPPKLVP